MTATPEFPGPSAATTRAITTATATPDPDPTLATLRTIRSASDNHADLVDSQLEAIATRITGVEREAAARRDGLREMLTQRFDAMDKANALLAADLRKVPTDLQVAILSIKELTDVKFAAVKAQADSTSAAFDARFDLLDKQTVREKAAADLALAAAFDAQKEASAATNNANAEAIRKSEIATAETIKTNAEAQRAGQQSLSDKIDDLKDRLNQQVAAVGAIQTSRAAISDAHADQRGGVGIVVGITGAILAFLAIVTTVILAVVLH